LFKKQSVFNLSASNAFQPLWGHQEPKDDKNFFSIVVFLAILIDFYVPQEKVSPEFLSSSLQLQLNM
jgi:hypothetical protein